MQYVTATIGAIFMFAACLIGCFILTAFRPFQGSLTVPLGASSFTIGNPIGFAGLPIGLFAAVHSFRSTLRREAIKAEKSRLNQIDLP
jgi:hypothetical protein